MESTTTKTNRKDCFNGRIGTSFESKTWLSLDPCGLMGVLCSLSVHVFAYITNALHLIEGSFLSTAIYVLVYTPFTFLAVVSLYMAWTTNPGAIPMGARPLVAVKRAGSQEMEEGGGGGGGGGGRSSRRATRRCHKCCDNFKPPRAHHDSVTGRCIVKFDHFCPWVGNAVGGLNHKFFVLFIGYTLASCIVTLLMMILRALHCNNSQQQQQSKSSSSSLSSNNAGEADLSHSNNNNNIPEEDQTRLRHYLSESSSSSSLEEECEGWFEAWSVLILLVVSVIFMIFTCCMLFEQIETIQTNSSKIARMKMKVGQAGTELERVTEEFNEMFGGSSNKVALHWFLPLQVEFPRGMRKAVLGYEWDECFDPIPYEEPGSNNNNGGTDNNNNNGTSLGDAGGGGGNNNNVKIELTPVGGRSQSSSPVPPANIIGEEDNFTGTPVKKKPPTNNLTKRSNSRDPDKRPKGTLT